MIDSRYGYLYIAEILVYVSALFMDLFKDIFYNEGQSG